MNLKRWLLASVFLAAGPGTLFCQTPKPTTSQTVKPQTTRISRQQIVSLLQQALPDAPQETGGGLYDGTQFRIGALKRKLPGEVEVHRDDTDILYVLSGSTVVVTGGAVEGMHSISPTEQRGTAIHDGVRHTLGAGDMLVIPKTEPHWFQKVSGEVSYLVIKVQEGAPAKP